MYFLSRGMYFLSRGVYFLSRCWYKTLASWHTFHQCSQTELSWFCPGRSKRWLISKQNSQHFFPQGLSYTGRDAASVAHLVASHLVSSWGKKIFYPDLPSPFPPPSIPPFLSALKLLLLYNINPNKRWRLKLISSVTVCSPCVLWVLPGGLGDQEYTYTHGWYDLYLQSQKTCHLKRKSHAHLVSLLVRSLSPRMLTRTEGRTKRLVTHPVFLHEFDCSSTANRPIIYTHLMLYMDHMI